MRVTSYGLFWRGSEVDWKPGNGNRNSFRLLGRIGSNRGSIRIADFRHQQGIYILFDQYGPSYVGLTRNQGLGKRLKDHTQDHLAGKWDRFSWFGFRPIDPTPTETGLLNFGQAVEELTENTNTTIGDLEALLIRAIGPKNNKAQMAFDGAKEWTQVEYDSADRYIGRLACAQN
ncbi:GIY-YIG nuclease family protein [Acetobacter fabarum]|jgi:hypothetical protein|uniref:GIY-YIG domain-containing protein n=1 Tax=Acetobacter fabarum TaxID=483199 RepID=A0A269XWE7_9PROT|nr:GIY-YIG nuclease family protein [Acetobacter fabarum]PAK77643.1 hypothetical protein B8X00_09905 [Acetobacter fabarum]PEN23281.1 hypothetical protein CRM93_12265 [Acetobacter fabarum]